MTDHNNRNTKLKTGIDIASAVFVIYFVGFGIWAKLIAPALGTTSPPSHGDLVALYMLFADMIPCIFGFAWLTWRYGDVVAHRLPFITKAWFPILFIISILLFNTIKHYYWR